MISSNKPTFRSAAEYYNYNSAVGKPICIVDQGYNYQPQQKALTVWANYEDQQSLEAASIQNVIDYTSSFYTSDLTVKQSNYALIHSDHYVNNFNEMPTGAVSLELTANTTNFLTQVKKSSLLPSFPENFIPNGETKFNGKVKLIVWILAIGAMLFFALKSGMVNINPCLMNCNYSIQNIYNPEQSIYQNNQMGGNTSQ